MAITMQGSWSVQVTKKNAAFQQRFIIQGSSNADGVYEGKVTTPVVNVIGNQWSITVEHKPTKSSSWLQSAERITTPTSSGSQIAFNIRSNDTGTDLDYDDLVLTCSAPASSADYTIYGRVRSYYGLCKFNPCFPYYFVIDSLAQLKDLLTVREVRSVLERLYPERIRELEKHPPIFRGPFPEPDPAPFRPMMIPMGNLPQQNVPVTEQMGTRNLAVPVSSAVALSDNVLRASSLVDVSAGIRDLARVKDRFKLFCQVEDQPGLLLRFLEYDRTADELTGGPYSGEGTRQILGYSVTDELGNYIFRFSRTLSDIAEEVSDIEAGGAPLATQLQPDIIVQVVSGMGEAVGILFETALHANMPNLRRINLCIPKDKLNPGPTACQGGRAIQSIGNIWTIAGMGNTLDAEGRITATYSTGPIITRAAWVGRLDMFACFLDRPGVMHYTIRYRRIRPGGSDSWAFVQQNYTHIFIPKIGFPLDPGHKVGPFNTSLSVDGGPPATVPAYKNIESDPQWIATHRLRKIQLASALYAPNTDVGTVEFWIEGYDGAGNKVAGADDKIRLYIDNKPIGGDIDTISMGGLAPGECALFELPSANETLTVRFKIDHPEGFLEQYSLNVLRGSNTNVPVSDTTAPVQPLSLSYSVATHGNFFYGTQNAVAPDASGYVLAELQPNSGSWLPAGKDFCAFAFEIHATPRVTDGYSTGVSRRLDVELVGISHTPPGP